jgi:hypothetical protein
MSFTEELRSRHQQRSAASLRPIVGIERTPDEIETMNVGSSFARHYALTVATQSVRSSAIATIEHCGELVVITTTSQGMPAVNTAQPKTSTSSPRQGTPVVNADLQRFTERQQ